MKSWSLTGFFLLLALPIFILNSDSFSQNKSFVGMKILKEGNKTAIQTIPEKNTLQNDYQNNHQIKSPDGIGDKYVLGGSVLWSFQDGAAIANYTELNPDGTIPVVGWGLNDMRVSRYTEVNNTPQWEFTTAPNDPAVDVADNYIVVSRGTEFDILDNPTGNVIFQYQMPDSLYATHVAISRNGSQAVFLAQSIGNGITSVVYSVDLSGGTPAVNWTMEVPTSDITNWAGVRFSAQGSTIVIDGRYHLYVLNSSDGSLIWDHFVSNTEAPAAISGDGSVIATADNSGFVQTWVWDNTSSEYHLLWQYRVPAGIYTNWASSVDVSADGNTIAAGTLIFVSGTQYDGTVITFDTYGDGTPKWIYSGLGDMVDDISLSDDGRVVAAATWGDYYTTNRTDLLVFDVATGDLTFSVVTTGSFFSVDLSPDGSRVFAGGKAVHAREFGNGGIVKYCEINLGGGSVTGTVDLTDTNDDSGVTVRAIGTPRSAVTDASGNYTIQNIPAGTYTIRAEKPGYDFGEVSNVVVTVGNTTSGINFSLNPSGIIPPVLSASTGEMGKITLSWLLPPEYSNPLKKMEMAKAVGDNYSSDLAVGMNLHSVKGRENKSAGFNPIQMKMLLADSVFIYRSPVSGGPYTKIAGVDITQTNYSDTTVFPLKDYYYVTNVVTASGQSAYSNEALGQVNDSLFTFSFSTPQGTDPVIDGVLSPGEWDDAYKVDVSDVLGYSGSPAVPQGSAFMYFKFDDQNNMLYIGGEDFLNTTLDDNEGFGLYFDDNHNKTFEPMGSLPIFQEGNFWAYWHPSGPDLRFRQIFKNGAVGNVITLTDGQVAFSQGSGHLQGEVAIPMGFMEGYQLQVYAPDKIVGLGGFLIERDAGNPVFHGWWPQTMNSVFEPHYFGDVNINVSLDAPPQIPGNIAVTKQGGNLLITWNDPTLGLNNDPLPVPPQIKIFKNGQFFANVGPGIQSIVDDNVGCIQWYQYTLQASIVVGSDTLVGPLSPPVGTYACQDPVLTEMKYDDGTWEAFYVVDFNYDKNKFALRFTPTYYPAKVMRLQTLVNNAGSFDFTILHDSLGVPGGRPIAGPYRVSSGVAGEARTITLTLPGSDPPEIQSGDFWVVINYLPESPGDPGIGVDADPPNSGRGMYYLGSTGWQSFVSGNLMITAFITDTTTATGNEQAVNSIPKTYELSQNYPNPFNPTTLISYQLPEAQNVTLEIYNSLGEKIRTLINESQNAGYHTIQWNGLNNTGRSVASGMYLYRITAGKFTSVKKMLLLR
jgi:hypothetical protein